MFLKTNKNVDQSMMCNLISENTFHDSEPQTNIPKYQVTNLNRFLGNSFSIKPQKLGNSLHPKSHQKSKNFSNDFNNRNLLPLNTTKAENYKNVDKSAFTYQTNFPFITKAKNLNKTLSQLKQNSNALLKTNTNFIKLKKQEKSDVRVSNPVQIVRDNYEAVKQRLKVKTRSSEMPKLRKKESP